MCVRELSAEAATGRVDCDFSRYLSYVAPVDVTRWGAHYRGSSVPGETSVALPSESPVRILGALCWLWGGPAGEVGDEGVLRHADHPPEHPAPCCAPFHPAPSRPGSHNGRRASPRYTPTRPAHRGRRGGNSQSARTMMAVAGQEDYHEQAQHRQRRRVLPGPRRARAIAGSGRGLPGSRARSRHSKRSPCGRPTRPRPART